VAGAHAHRLAEVRAVQALPHVQVEQRSVPFGQSGRSAPDELAQRHLLGRAVRPGIGVRHVLHLVEHDPAAGPDHPQRHAARDGVEPGPEPLGVVQLREPLGDEDEGVLHGVRGFVAVAQDGVAEVVQPVGVAVVDRRERLPVASQHTGDQLGVGVLGRITHARVASGPGRWWLALTESPRGG
jgi:hypothetical protein